MTDWRTTDKATVTVTVESIAGTGRDGQVAIKGVVEGVSPQNHAIPLYLPLGVTPVAGSTVYAVVAKGRYKGKNANGDGSPPADARTWDFFYDLIAWDVEAGHQAPVAAARTATGAAPMESNSTKDSIELGNTKAAASRMFAGVAAITGEVPNPEDFARYVSKVHAAVHGSPTEAPVTAPSVPVDAFDALQSASVPQPQQPQAPLQEQPGDVTEERPW